MSFFCTHLNSLGPRVLSAKLVEIDQVITITIPDRVLSTKFTNLCKLKPASWYTTMRFFNTLNCYNVLTKSKLNPRKIYYALCIQMTGYSVVSLSGRGEYLTEKCAFDKHLVSFAWLYIFIAIFYLQQSIYLSCVQFFVVLKYIVLFNWSTTCICTQSYI